MGGRERGVRVAEGRGGKGNEVTKSTCEEEAEVEGRYGHGRYGYTSELYNRNGGLIDGVNGVSDSNVCLL